MIAKALFMLCFETSQKLFFGLKVKLYFVKLSRADMMNHDCTCLIFFPKIWRRSGRAGEIERVSRGWPRKPYKSNQTR